MATKILNDIYADLKLLITTLTGFEEDEEGFSICERFVLSNVRHHRFLSVNAHATSKRLDEIEEKFLVHGKYEVARKFHKLVSIFLGSFDFKSHPQHDLQWSLLTLLLDLSGETDKVDLETPACSKYEHSSLEKTLLGDNEDSTEVIDWARYLNEDQPEFFRDYGSEDESEWSEEEEEDDVEILSTTGKSSKPDASDSNQWKEKTKNSLEKMSECRERKVHAEGWLAANIQNIWWNELEWHRHRVESDFNDAKLCDIWQSAVKDSTDVTVTLSEYQVCRELLWMFHSPTRMLVFEYQDGEFLVRPNLSIPSLTTTGFRETLGHFCKYFSMIKEIEDFGRDLYSRNSIASQLPSLTYETYFAAIKKKLFEFRRELLELEIRMLKQDEINSLLTLSMELKSSLVSVEMIYELHRSVISDWKILPNWKCSSKLLSSLYFEMRNSSNLARTHFAASLYLSSLSVYLNIIDTWLSEGLLEDYRDEFVVAKRSNNEVSEDEGKQQQQQQQQQQEQEQSEKFILRPLDRICSKDPIMQLLLHKIRYMGRSIEILVSLDRISDMWKTLPNKDDTDSRSSLNDQLHVNLRLEFTKYAKSSFLEDQTDASTFPPKAESYDSDLESNIMRQISRSPNPFLLKAFERYLPSLEFCKKIDEPDTDGCFNDSFSRSKNKNFLESLEKSKATLPLRKILESSLSAILDSRYSSASKLVKTILLNEYKLEAHLKLMRCVYMMERGHIMNKFYQPLFVQIESNPIWNNSYFLMCILEEVLSQEWPDSSSLWSISVPDIPTHRVLEAIDQLTLHYAIGWPINMVLNKDSLVKYNEIFRFQLKLKWALWTLNNLQFSDLEGSWKTFTAGGEDLDEIQHFQIRRLEALRFWLLHAIGSIHSYLCGQVLQSLGQIFEKALRNAENLGAIITVHDKYLDTVHEHCLQTSEYEDLLATINNLLEMCVHVRERWKRGKVVFAPTELSLMESNYIKYHTYLALALRNAVEHKDADYYELTPYFHMNIDEDEDIAYVKAKHDIINERMSNLSRNLLSEIAFQTLPPSGIPLPIPVLVRKRRKSWQGYRIIHLITFQKIFYKFTKNPQCPFPFGCTILGIDKFVVLRNQIFSKMRIQHFLVSI